MVDYRFLDDKKKEGPPSIGPIEEELPPGRVEFFDVDLPPSKKHHIGKDATFEILSTTDMVRQQIKSGEAGLESMKKEAEALTVENSDDFNKAVEMIGQIKNLKKSLTDTVNAIIQPIYQEYKSGRNILTSFTPKLDAIQAAIKEKQDAYAYKAEMARREAERKAAEETAKLQAKIDAEQKALEEAERKAAKAEKREPVKYEPIKVDTPVIPKEIKTTTESGSAKIEMVLVPTITNAKSEYVIDKVLYYFEKQFMDLALKAANKAIKAGAIGLKGAPGITVEEKAITKHRRR